MKKILKSFIKFWMPSGMLELIRRWRNTRPERHSVESLVYSDVPLLLDIKGIEAVFPGFEKVNLDFPLKEMIRESEMVLPLAELIAISVICKLIKPRTIFEIGTYKGSSTLLLSANSPEDAHIFTLDLSNDEIKNLMIPYYVPGEYINKEDQKIKQLFGDSRYFDFSPYQNSQDLVFIDANHTYDFVRSDSENAFRMLSENGVIIWDDYAWTEKHPECSGVAKYLNEIRFEKRCVQIAGTRLAIFKNTY